MNTGCSVRDAMTNKPISCNKDITLQQAAVLMTKHDVGSLLVMDGSELIGILTEDDFVTKAAAKGLWLDTKIEKVMTTKLLSISPNKDILDASKLMNEHNIHHLPVMESGKLIGFLTMSTILKIEPQLVELLVETKEMRGIGPSSSLVQSMDDEFEGKCESCGNYSSHLQAVENKNLCPNCSESYW